jgi:hypothetical protein
LPILAQNEKILKSSLFTIIIYIVEWYTIKFLWGRGAVLRLGSIRAAKFLTSIAQSNFKEDFFRGGQKNVFVQT